MNIVGYVRVSTQAQAEGQGPEVQRAGITAWAEENGHKIILWCEDLALSGATGLTGRPKLATAISAIKEGFVEAIVVFRLDRLARDLVLQETLLAEIRRIGGELHSCQAGEDQVLRDDATDPSRKLIRQVLGAVAEYERAIISIRMHAGKRAKMAAGGWGGGKPPYGWAAIGNELVPRADEQDVLVGIWGLRDLGWSGRRIATYLNDELHLKPRQGEVWHYRTVENILKRGRKVEPSRI